VAEFSITELRHDLSSVADPDRRTAMSTYMKHRFVFLGVGAVVRKAASRSFVTAGTGLTSDELFDAADACWDEPEREFQYVGADLLRRHSSRLDGLTRVERLIRSKSWWDTVDALAAHVVGPIARNDPGQVSTLDTWIDDDEIWVARTAILFQLGAGDATDRDRLFGYVDRRCDDTEFFIRKACGWALRQYARLEPDAVRDFVDSRGDRLSGLTRREALKHLEA